MNNHKLYIADPCLIDFKGHYFSYDKSISDAYNNKYKLDQCIILCNKNVSEDVVNVINCVKTFTHDIFVEVNNNENGNKKTQENFITINNAFLLDLIEFCNKYSTTNDDVVFFPNINQNQLLGIYKWLNLIETNKCPKVVITLRYMNANMAYNTNREMEQSIVNCYKQIIPLLGNLPNVRIITDTQALTNFYSSLSETKMYTFPIPHSLEIPYKTSLSEKITISQIGTWSNYKGSHLVTKIIQPIVDKFEKVSFFIQTDKNITSEELITLDHVKKLYKERVTIISGTLSNADYNNYLLNTDLLLLAYSPEHYAYQSSGVLIEAASLGKVIVTTKNTFMHAQSIEFNLGSVIMENQNEIELLSAIEFGISNIENLKIKSELAKVDIIRYHNATNFVNKLLELH
jgi:glycosyltransferase involved in cell wall biosynthesis